MGYFRGMPDRCCYITLLQESTIVPEESTDRFYFANSKRPATLVINWGMNTAEKKWGTERVLSQQGMSIYL